MVDDSPISEGGTGQPTTGVGGMSVPLGVHVEALMQRDLRLARAIREGDLRFEQERDRRITDHFTHIRELRMMQRDADQLAIRTALTAQKELADKHNDLIRSGEKKDETYATKIELSVVEKHLSESLARLATWQARLTGAFFLLSLIGVANFVRLLVGA